MSESDEKCALCHKRKKLCSSHIIPNSFIKKVRRGSPQLIVVTADESTKPRLDNVGAKEKMLCHDCEQLFSSNFEQYGTSLLRRSKNIVKGNKNIIVYNYQHDRFYLYCLSIFWRMAQSKLDEFKNVLFPPRVSDIIRNCLLMNTLAINERMDINEIMKINILKIHDPLSEKRTYYIQHVLCPCHTDYTNNEYKISFLAEGLFYTLRLDLNPDNFQKNKNKGLPLGKALKIKKIDYREIAELHYSIDRIFVKAREYPSI